MKKGIILLATSMALTGFSLMGANAEVADTETIDASCVYHNFGASYTSTGAAPFVRDIVASSAITTTWAVSSAAAYEPTTEDSKSLNLKAGYSADWWLRDKTGYVRSTQPTLADDFQYINGCHVFEYSYYFYCDSLDSSVGGDVFTDQVLVSSGTDMYPKQILKIEQTGKVSVDGDVKSTISSGKWYNIKRVVDFDNQTVSVLLNDVPLNTISATFKVARRSIVTVPNTYAGNIYIDNMAFEKRTANAIELTGTTAEKPVGDYNVGDFLRNVPMKVTGFKGADRVDVLVSKDGVNYEAVSSVAPKDEPLIDGTDGAVSVQLKAYGKGDVLMGTSEVKTVTGDSSKTNVKSINFAGVTTNADYLSEKGVVLSGGATAIDAAGEYFGECVSLLSTESEASSAEISGTAGLTQESYTMAEGEGYQNKMPQIFALVRGNFMFNNFNSEKNILKLLGQNTDFSTVELVCPKVLSDGTLVFSDNEEKALTKLSKGKFYNIASIIDIKGKVSHILVNGVEVGSAKICDSDLININKVSVNSDISANETQSQMYFDDFELSTFQFDKFLLGTPVYKLGDTVIENNTFDTDGAFTGSFVITNDGAAKDITAVIAKYDGNALGECMVYPITFNSGDITKTINMDFGQVTAGDKISAMYFDDLTSLVPLKSADKFNQ